MADLSDYAEREILDAIFNGGSFSIATPYVSLHTADPTDAGGSEVSGGSYGRQDGSAAFPAASGTTGALSNDAALSWSDMPGATVTHVGIYDASTAGNLIAKAALSSSKVVNAGDTFQIAIGNLTFTLA